MNPLSLEKIERDEMPLADRLAMIRQITQGDKQ